MASLRAWVSGPMLILLVGTTSLALDRASVEHWRSDIGAFRKVAPTIHKNMFHTIPQREFNELVDKLEQDLPRLGRDEAIVRFAEIVARIGDGHTYVDLAAEPVGFHQLPVQLYSFADGIFVVATDAGHESLLGAQVKAIGGYPAAEAFRRVSAVVSADNESQLHWLAPLVMTIPEVLHGLHITRDQNQVPLVIDKDGKEQLLVLSPLATRPIISAWNVPQDWRRLPAQSTHVLWLRDPSNPFWMERLTSARTIYVQVNGIYPKPNQSLSGFLDAALHEAETPAYDKLVLDLRLATGGNSEFLLPVIHRLIRSEKFNKRGALFVITGRQTFSAAQNFVDYLEIHTPAIFIGEPSAGSPNHYGDPEVFQLPHSDIPVRLSTTWWQTAGPKDARKWTAPEIFCELRFTDFVAGKDPALDAVLDWNVGNTLGARVVSAVRSNNATEAKQVIDQFRADPRFKYASAESEVHRAADELALIGNVHIATSVLETLTEVFPQSARAHEHLADMYLQSGKVDLAVAEFEKALQLDPKDANARIMLGRLKK